MLTRIKPGTASQLCNDCTHRRGSGCKQKDTVRLVIDFDAGKTECNKFAFKNRKGTCNE